MSRSVACRRCGKPNPKSLCDSCHGSTYGSGEYARNSAILRNAASSAIQRGIPVYCVICEMRILSPQQVTVEHIRSVSQGGSNEMRNLAPAHFGCNSAKRPVLGR